MPAVYEGHAHALPPASGTVVAIGNFDGVHVGHRAVLARTGALAGEVGAAPWVYTFDPAPTAVVAPSRHQPRITTLTTRLRRLKDAGAEAVVVERFDAAFAAVPAETFAKEILGEHLRARALVVGHDFRFGAGRAGDADALRAWLPGVQVVSVDAVEVDGTPVSSSRLRRVLASGDVAMAARLLGERSTLGGVVVTGDQRGRTIGVPTANVVVEEELRPARGVYAGWATVPGGRFAAVANLGVRPTVDGERESFEVHLLDFAGDLYGARLELAFVARLRDERRFSGLDALRAQIAEDIAAARGCLA